MVVPDGRILVYICLATFHYHSLQSLSFLSFLSSLHINHFMRPVFVFCCCFFSCPIVFECKSACDSAPLRCVTRVRAGSFCGLAGKKHRLFVSSFSF